jgi:1-acyl-sn-glycerol-3-phosphate acyltransferase
MKIPKSPRLVRKLKGIRIIRKDPFGKILLIKRALIGVLGFLTYSRFNIINKLKVEGTEHLQNLPSNNVLFVSNHQTYYADVIALYHIFSSVKWNFKNSIRIPIYAILPRVNTYYVAAEETMKSSGFLPKVFAYAGAITVKRSWRYKGESVDRAPDTSAPEKIKKALQQGWVVNFPQGTTTPYAPIRKGSAAILKTYQPTVIPVVIDGFRRAFDKKGLKIKKKGVVLQVRFKEPLVYSADESIESLIEKIRAAIEQIPPSDLQTLVSHD